MLLADVTFSTEALLLIGSLMGALVGAIGLLFKLLQASKDTQITGLQAEVKSYRDIADEAIKSLESKVNEIRTRQGLAPAVIVAAVVPEHSSPTTEAQQATADLQTMRARLVAATLGLDLPARVGGEPERLTDPGGN